MCDSLFLYAFFILLPFVGLISCLGTTALNYTKLLFKLTSCPHTNTQVILEKELFVFLQLPLLAQLHVV